MASISASGIACAAPIGASAGSGAPIGRVQRLLRRLGAAMIVVATLGGGTPVSRLEVQVDSVRSDKGMLRLCLTADPRNFPGCVDDQDAITRSVPAGTRLIRFEALARGDYALAVIHDENGNARLDTIVGIPREGFGFSRNPPIRFGAPRFAAARFTVTGDAAEQQVRMRYLL